jgi:hypothetical protein
MSRALACISHAATLACAVKDLSALPRGPSEPLLITVVSANEHVTALGAALVAPCAISPEDAFVQQLRDFASPGRPYSFEISLRRLRPYPDDFKRNGALDIELRAVLEAVAQHITICAALVNVDSFERIPLIPTLTPSLDTRCVLASLEVPLDDRCLSICQLACVSHEVSALQ